MVLTLINKNENINNLGLEFEVDNSQSVQINYIYDSIIFTDLDKTINKNFRGYLFTDFFPNFVVAMTGKEI